MTTSIKKVSSTYPEFYNLTPILENPQFSTLLDAKSISEHLPNNSGFRKFALEKCEAEMLAVRKLYELVFNDRTWYRINKLDNCRTAAYFMRHKETGQVRVASRSCHIRFCPLCSAARGNYIRHRTKEWLESVAEPKFITFTLKHSDEFLHNQIKKLYDCFKKIRRHKLFTKALRGGIWFFQIKKSNSDQLWHPHIHFIADCKFISARKISKAWKELTEDSSIIDIRQVKDAGKAADYVARYAVTPCKIAGLNENDAQELYYALQGRRLSGTVGNAFKAKIMAKPKFEGSQWEKLFSFSIIEKLRHDDDAAAAIWKSWHLSQPLEKDIDISHLVILQIRSGSPPPPPKSNSTSQYYIEF
ncbi:MAG: protein rep [Draconibacterium sp.]